MVSMPGSVRRSRRAAATAGRSMAGRSKGMLKVGAVVFGLALVVSSCVSADQTRVFNQVNNSRASSGIAAMAQNGWMSDFAQRWAEHMAAKCTLAHSSNYATANPYNWRSLAENVGSGTSLSSVHTAFMNSAGHRANILNPRFNYLGTGVAQGCGRYWVVHEFMQL